MEAVPDCGFWFNAVEESGGNNEWGHVNVHIRVCLCSAASTI